MYIAQLCIAFSSYIDSGDCKNCHEEGENGDNQSDWAAGFDRAEDIGSGNRVSDPLLSSPRSL